MLLELGGQMTYFKMTKLMYLVDLFALKKFGYSVASSIYLRQVEGPWPPDLDQALEAMKGSRSDTPRATARPRFRHSNGTASSGFRGSPCQHLMRWFGTSGSRRRL